MPRPCPPEFRACAIALECAGKQAKQTAVELGIHPVMLSVWVSEAAWLSFRSSRKHGTR